MRDSRIDENGKGEREMERERRPFFLLFRGRSKRAVGPLLQS